MVESMGKSVETATVTVNYRFIEGQHVFTSEDVYGLYIAFSDPSKAYGALVGSIEKLIELNEGVRCTVRPTMPLREFLDRLKPDAHAIPHPAYLSDQQFVVDCRN